MTEIQPRSHSVCSKISWHVALAFFRPTPAPGLEALRFEHDHGSTKDPRERVRARAQASETTHVGARRSEGSVHLSETRVTLGYRLPPKRTKSYMPLEIDGVTCYTAADVHRDVGVARQTLWRGRKTRKIPQDRRYRDRQALFTTEGSRRFASTRTAWLEPVEPTEANQLKPFSPGAPKRNVR